MGTPTFATPVNRVELELKVKQMYQRVALEPTGEFHFEMGRGLALRLGYAPEDLDRIPQEAIDSFAGVGYHFDLADLQAGEQVLDLGSGSGMDTFVAALKVGPHGRVVGVDMTDAQRAKAERLREAAGFTQTTYVSGYIEALPVEDEGFDAVISNGVINLSADKPQVFREVARVLRRGGRLALSDILSEKWLPESVTCNATLWAACIGGAMQQEAYFEAMRAAGLRIVRTRENPQYRFLTASAQKACATYGVRSVSLLAVRD
jgi:ubiquinone/menaquinone biosynthesis C-methylase UbiE